MPFIVAIDYDGTLFLDSFPEVGNPNHKVIDKAKEFKNHNAEVVLWTCREGKYLDEAIEACKKLGLEFDSHNENSPSQKKYQIEVIEKENGETFAISKIFADIYVDDRAHGSIDFFLGIDVKNTCKNFGER